MSLPSPNTEITMPDVALPIDEDHHPGKPGINFLPLYLTVIAIFLLAVGIQIMTCYLKKRRAKNPEIDLEANTNKDRFQSWWYPWRYDKDGNYIDPKAKAANKAKSSKSSSSGSERTIVGSGSDGTGTSTSTLVSPDPPQLPPLAHTHNAALYKLVYRADVKGRGKAADDGPGTPMMSGALSPDGLDSPIHLQAVNARLDGARYSASTASRCPTASYDPAVMGYIGDSSGKPLPPVNPFTNKPFTQHAPRNLSQSNNDELSGSPFRESPDSTVSSGVETKDFAHGYGVAAEDPFNTPSKEPSSKDDHYANKSRGHGSSEDPQRDRVTSTTQGTSSSSRSDPSRQHPSSSSQGSSSRHGSSSSRKGSSRRGESSRAQSSRHGEPSFRSESTRGRSSRHHASSSSQDPPSSSQPGGSSSSHRPASSSQGSPSSTRGSETSQAPAPPKFVPGLGRFQNVRRRPGDKGEHIPGK